MDSLVRSSSTTDSSPAHGDGGGSEKQRKAERQEAAVLYLTILSTLASLSGVQGEGDYGAKMSKALEEWQEAFSKQVRVNSYCINIGMLQSDRLTVVCHIAQTTPGCVPQHRRRRGQQAHQHAGLLRRDRGRGRADPGR